MLFLIIGQAPPQKKQIIPFDTTLLYEIFAKINKSKNFVIENFEFESLIGFFPGSINGKHKLPSKKDIDNHFKSILYEKVKKHKNILFLGKMSENYFKKNHLNLLKDKNVLFLIHPSRRNYFKINNSIDDIKFELNKFILNAK